MEYQGYTIEAIELEKEINYVVTKAGNYLFRMVPGHNGFELSKLDLALACELDPKLQPAITEYILNRDE